MRSLADDEWFAPLIERFVMWNNLYSQRTDIQGDYDVLLREAIDGEVH